MTGQPSSRPMNLSACLKQVTSKPENAVKLINIILFSFLLETDSLGKNAAQKRSREHIYILVSCNQQKHLII
jgi:hypothetical protein